MSDELAKIGARGYDDMRLRVLNARPCPIKVSFGEVRDCCWEYGTLFLSIRHDGETCLATFGDLTIPVTLFEALTLVGIAAEKD